MGTPGDKTKLGKVVETDPSQLDPEKGEEQPPEPHEIPSASVQQQAAEAMGVYTEAYTRLPEFETFAEYNITPSLPEAPEKIQQFTPVSLGQATIEDYFVQSKYYPSLSESLSQPTYVPEETFRSIDEPGPSGLQTPHKRLASTVPPKVKKTKKSQQASKKLFECSVCQKSFSNAAKLAKHQHIHGGSSPFKCEYCKKLFTSRFKLVRHALIHSDRKPFSCQVCERTFHRKDHLKNHIKVHSPSKKVYVCERPDCKKEYTSNLSFRKHLALHAAEDGSLECQICYSTFENKDQILYHLKIHAGSRTVKNPNEKKFTCEHCDRKFFTKKDVRRHLVVHTGMRDFLCQFCPQRFGRKDHLVRHIKKSHSKNVSCETEAESTVTVKTETETVLIKTELPEQFAPLDFIEGFESTSLIFGQELEPLIQETDTEQLQYLPSTSQQAVEVPFLEEVPEEEVVTNPDDIPPQLTALMQDSEIIRLLQPSGDKNLPLPAFDKTFQSPPPPPPP